MTKVVICLLAAAACFQTPLPGAVGNGERIDPPVAVEGFSWAREPMPPDMLALFQDPRVPHSPPIVVQPSLAREYFRYTLRLRNAGALPIASVAWDYVFRDPSTQKEIARIHFRSKTNVKPGRTKPVYGYTPLPPTDVVSVAQLQSGVRNGAGESVEIHRIVFADNTVWPPALGAMDNARSDFAPASFPRITLSPLAD
jgi:hypothetical protein